MDKEYVESCIQDIRKDPLREPIVGLVGEFRAMYYSHARKNLSTVVAGEAMESNQDLRDLQLLRRIREEKPNESSQVG